MTLGQGRHLHRIVDNERGLDILALALLAENLVYEFAFAHGVVHLDAVVAGEVAKLVLALAVDVEAGVLQDGVAHGDAGIRRLEVYLMVAELHLGGAVHVQRYLL